MVIVKHGRPSVHSQTRFLKTVILKHDSQMFICHLQQTYTKSRLSSQMIEYFVYILYIVLSPQTIDKLLLCILIGALCVKDDSRQDFVTECKPSLVIIKCSCHRWKTKAKGHSDTISFWYQSLFHQISVLAKKYTLIYSSSEKKKFPRNVSEYFCALIISKPHREKCSRLRVSKYVRPHGLPSHVCGYTEGVKEKKKRVGCVFMLYFV